MFKLLQKREWSKVTRLSEDLITAQSSEARLQQVIEAISDELIVVNAEGKITLWNEPAAKGWGRTQAETIGKPLFEVLPEITSVAFKSALDRALQDSREAVLANFQVTRANSPNFYHVRILPFPGGASIFLDDITARCKVEASHAKLSEILEATTDYVAYADADGRITYLNQAFRKTVGISNSEDISQLRLRDFHLKWPENLALNEAKVSISGDRVWSGEAVLLTRKKVEVALSQVILLHKGPDGAITHISSIGRDISSAKRAEKRGWQFAQELRTSQEKFETLVNSVDGIVWEATAESKAFTFVSQRAERILGYPCEQWLSVPGFWEANLHSDDRATATEYRQRETAKGKNYICEYRMVASGGRTVWVRDYTNVIREEGQPTLLRGILIDISEQKKADSELERLNKELVETSRMAGMAEVATGVLHNVGNVLNSVNVTATFLRENLRRSELASLIKVADLFEKNNQNLAQYLTEDPKGKLIPGFVVQLTQHLKRDHLEMQKECEQLATNIEHIKEIVSMQQSYARVSGCMETVSVAGLMENALQINAESFARHKIEVIRD
ncbi:MAG: PAS domain S-box protein, partial [Verrucomicrobiota bacterium]